MYKEEWKDRVPESPDGTEGDLQISQVLGVAGAPRGGRVPCPIPPVLDCVQSGGVQSKARLSTSVPGLST